ncbi:MAG: hypothetical protein CL930_04775 [Deltaproteobacteria bacterium]|nr:hypothetical protein [Deltaproteobacteria bacterium]|tara:strand:- start:422 stop:1297 length:876 start_codon:yes stop_codon:yes gene_type:complete
MLVFLFTLFGCWGDAPVAHHALGSGGERSVWMFRKTDAGWRRNESPVAHGMSSLGLGQEGDSLVLTAQCFWGDCGSERIRRKVGPPVHAIRTADLNGWDAAMWRLKDTADRVPIDTEYRSDSQGGVVWYYGTAAGALGDPAHHAQPHRIFSARVVGDLLESPVLRMTGNGFADPAPLQVGTEQWLFLTTQPGRKIGLAKGEPLRLEREWDGVSVPHAMWVDDAIWLWAQRVEKGRMVPVRSISTDRGQTWSEWANPLPMEGMEGCGNPVGAVFNGIPVVFCVTEPLGAPKP